MSIQEIINSKGKKTYRVKLYYKDVQGIQRQYTKRGFTTKTDAKKHESIMKAQILQEKINALSKKPTLNKVYDEFIKYGCEGVYQHNTIQGTKAVYKHFKSELGNVEIDKINFKVLQQYFYNRKEKSKATNKDIKKALNRIMKYALQVGYIEHNPCTNITVLGVEKTKERKEVLSDKEFNQILLYLKANENEKYDNYYIALCVSYYMGMRISEVLALEKSDIDFINDTININKKLNYKGLKQKDYYISHDLKSETSKSVLPMPKPLKAILKNWVEQIDGDILFTNKKGYYLSPVLLNNDINKIASLYGFEFRFHLLRHTYATMLHDNGVSPKMAQELLRHSNFNTTLSIYTHLKNDDKKDTVNGIFGSNSAVYSTTLKN